MILNSNEIIIQAITSTFKRDILPVLKSESSALAGQLIFASLGMLLDREKPMPSSFRKILEDQQALCERMESLLQQNNVLTYAEGSAHSLEFLEKHAYPESSKSQLAFCERLWACANALTKLRDNTEQPDEINDLLEEMARNDLALTNTFIANMEQTLSSFNGSKDKSVSVEKIKAYLDKRFPEKNYVTVTNLASSGFGISKQTFFFDVESSDGKKSNLVLRQEKPAQPMALDCTQVKNEFHLIRDAFKLGLPAPEPLWLETEGGLGPDFLVMQKVKGSQLGEPFEAYQPLSETVLMDIAEFLAKLHSVGLEPFTDFLEYSGQKETLQMNTAEATLFRIQRWEQYYNEVEQYPNPGKVWLFDWLKRNVPANSSPPVMVHGDFNIHNLLAENDRITACLDWEFGHPGNPLEDLNNIKKHVDKYWNWDRFYNHYVAHGGPKVELDNKILDYNTCLTNTIYSTASNRLAWLVENNLVSDLAAVYGANSFASKFHQLALSGSLDTD